MSRQTSYQKGERYHQRGCDRSTQNQSNEIRFLLVISPMKDHYGDCKHHEYSRKQPSGANAQRFRQADIEGDDGSQCN